MSQKDHVHKSGTDTGVRNCAGCRHYYVTWEPAHPHGCRAYGFKSRNIPAAVVRESSGEPCRMYEPKGGTPHPQD